MGILASTLPEEERDFVKIHLAGYAKIGRKEKN